MTGPEDNPQDETQSFPCPNCGEYAVSRIAESGEWQCANCDWMPAKREG
jgi:ribosomal protein L37AE/L43A